MENESPSGPEPAVLIGLQREGQTRADADESLAELTRLIESAGAEVLDARTIQLRKMRASTFISKGHLEDLVHWADALDPELVVLDDDVSPGQQRNLEEAFERRFLTRTEVILDIFAKHAQTREAMTQVELAQLRYLMPRLVGMPIATARMGGATGGQKGQGGIATRGPGETQLEVDRRRMRTRIRRLEKTLKEIQQHRDTQRQRRMRSAMPLVGIVGYTNAGKSTLLNRLTSAGVLAENRLFSTLDTTVRHLALPDGMEVGLIDTVGFVSKLPTVLVAAFRATLEETTYADVILHVVDSASPRVELECAATDDILRTLGCEDTPRLTVWNKTDLLDDPVAVNALMLQRQPSVTVSALEGTGTDDLLAEAQKMLLARSNEVFLCIPYDHYDLVARLHRESQVIDSRDTAEGKLLRCLISAELASTVEPYEMDIWPDEG